MLKLVISGKSNVGKDTVMKLLIKEFKKYKLKCKSIAFADPIKEIALLMFPKLKREYFYGPSELRNTIIPKAKDNEGKNLTCRQLLLDIGTKLGRKYNKSIWINNLHDTIDNYHNKYDVVIITDGRFENELKNLKKNGFKCIRVIRDTKYKVKHSSDMDQNKISNSFFHYVIDNNGEISDLKLKIKDIVKNLKNS